MASQIVELTGDEAKLLRSLDRIIQKEREHERKLASVGDAGDQAGRRIGQGMDSASKATSGHVESIRKHLERIPVIGGKAADTLFGKIDQGNKKSAASFEVLRLSAVAKLGAIAGGYQLINKAAQTYLDLNDKIVERDKSGFDTLRGVEAGDRRLLQVSGGDQASFIRLRARSDALSRAYGIERTTARDLVFQSKSEGFEDAVGFIGSRSQLIDPKAQAIAAGKVPGLFRASGESIAPQQAINAIFAAAAESNLDFESLTQVLPSAAEGTSQIGASAAETIAATSVLSSRTGGPAEAANRVKAFSAKAALDPRLKNAGGLLPAVKTLQAFSEEDRKKFLGENQELNASYTFLTEELANIEQRLAVTQSAIDTTGTAESPTARAVEVNRNNPFFQTTLRERRARIREEIATENRRAIVAGRAIAKKREAIAAAEEGRSSKSGIEAGLLLSDVNERLTGRVSDGSTVRALANDPLTNLQRGLALAGSQGNQKATAANLLVSRLRNAQQQSPGASLPADAVSDYIFSTTGRRVSPASIPADVRQQVTQTVLSEAGSSPSYGAIKGISIASDFFTAPLGKAASVFNPSNPVSASAGASSADRIAAAMERQNELLTRSLELSERAVTASERAASAGEQTANNTAAGTDEPVDYGAIQRGREE